MKKELIGTIICILLISVAVAPVINAFTNEINEAKEPPQPAEWPPFSQCVEFGFGLYSNLTREFNGDEYYWSFTCEDVICCLGICEEPKHWHHYTNGEKVYIYGAFFFRFKGNFFLAF